MLVVTALPTRNELTALATCVEAADYFLSRVTIDLASAVVERMIAESSAELADLLTPLDDGCYTCGALATVAGEQGDLCEDCWTMRQEEGQP